MMFYKDKKTCAMVGNSDDVLGDAYVDVRILSPAAPGVA